MLSKLTLIGMNNYSNGAIWDNIELPEGIDKDILINEILKQNGEFCVLYSDMDFLTLQIQCFFKKWYSSFEKWINVLTEEYQPLFNVDVKTSFEETGENHDLENKTSTSSASGSINGTSTNIESKVIDTTGMLSYFSDEFTKLREEFYKKTGKRFGICIQNAHRTQTDRSKR